MIYLASTYGSGTYDSSNYNGTSTTGTGTGSTGGSAGGAGTGVLTDTGIALVAAVTVACVIVLIATAVRIWKRPAKSASVETDEV